MLKRGLAKIQQLFDVRPFKYIDNIGTMYKEWYFQHSSEIFIHTIKDNSSNIENQLFRHTGGWGIRHWGLVQCKPAIVLQEIWNLFNIYFEYILGECHRTSPMRIQHWFNWWLGFIRPQAITWVNVDSDWYLHMIWLGHNELTLQTGNYFGLKKHITHQTCFC